MSLFFKTKDGTQYRKDIIGNKSWWKVNHHGSWYVISGEPSEKLIPMEKSNG